MSEEDQDLQKLLEDKESSNNNILVAHVPDHIAKLFYRHANGYVAISDAKEKRSQVLEGTTKSSEFDSFLNPETPLIKDPNLISIISPSFQNGYIALEKKEPELAFRYFEMAVHREINAEKYPEFYKVAAVLFFFSLTQLKLYQAELTKNTDLESTKERLLEADRAYGNMILCSGDEFGENDGGLQKKLIELKSQILESR